jgi:hypothetical protein
MNNHARDKDKHPSQSNLGTRGPSEPMGRTVRSFWCPTGADPGDARWDGAGNRRGKDDGGRRPRGGGGAGWGGGIVSSARHSGEGRAGAGIAASRGVGVGVAAIAGRVDRRGGVDSFLAGMAENGVRASK